MKTTREVTPTQWANLMLGLSMFLGLIVRLFPGWMAGFPPNDGGMFHVMVRDLAANGFRLPEFTTYNASQIPFAYPPLGFYLAAVLNAGGIALLDVLRWAPPVVNWLSIAGFYLLTAELLDDRPRAALAAAFFALTPGSYEWQIMGGGLTRSLGMAFFAVAVLAVHRMLRGGWCVAALSSALCALAVLSHPEAGLATASSCALVWVFFGRRRGASTRAVLVAAGVLLLTSPWWGAVLAQHGWTPVASVLHSGGYARPLWSGLYEDFLEPSNLLGVQGPLTIAGFIWCIRLRRYFLPAWLLLPYLVEPRSAAAMSFLPACMLAAIGLAEAAPAALDWIRRRWGLAPARLELVHSGALSIALLGIILLTFVASALNNFRLVNTSLIPPEPQRAFEWVQSTTAPDSRFVIMTGQTGVLIDPVQEWFPALADRRSQSTPQGLEWTLGAGFMPRLQALISLQECREVSCVEAWSENTGLSFSHILVRRSESLQGLNAALETDRRYRLLYENPEILIFVGPEENQ